MPDLNRLLSELIEPMPTQELAYGCYHALSDKKGWRWMYSYKGVGHWQPRAWDTDETASAFLMDLAPMHFTHRTNGICSADYGWGCFVEHADRKTAIRNAAYEWLTHKRQTGGKD